HYVRWGANENRRIVRATIAGREATKLPTQLVAAEAAAKVHNYKEALRCCLELLDDRSSVNGESSLTIYAICRTLMEADEYEFAAKLIDRLQKRYGLTKAIFALNGIYYLRSSN